ncbi:EG45-like domain containing protein [Linum perenne]
MSTKLSSFLVLVIILHQSCIILANIGSASWYRPPYLPTACNGNDGSQFPTSNLFAAAGEGIWDNGAACGRQYRVRCQSAVARGSCKPGQIVQVKIVDRAQTLVSQPPFKGTTIVLSQTAFGIIADSTASTAINIDYEKGVTATELLPAAAG